MNHVTWPTRILGFSGIGLLVFGLAAVALFFVMDPTGAPRKAYKDYTDQLDREIRFLMLKTTGQIIARWQVAIAVAVIAAALITGKLFLLAALLLVAIGPKISLQSQHATRVLTLEKQLDGWLLIMANAMKASPSLGDAFQSSARLTRAPLADEIDLVVKETRLGTPLDQALLNMSTRIGSRVFSGAVATMLVGRQTGGDLPTILETSAASLREMQRLEGVIRAKTSENKGQAVVLAAVPYFLVFVINWMDPNFMAPLFNTPTGYLLLGVSFVMWCAAIVWMRAILAVDV